MRRDRLCDRERLLRLVTGVGLVTLVGLGGCSKAESSAPKAAASQGQSAAKPAASATPAPDPAFLAEVKKRVDEAYQGNERPPPTGGKAPQKGSQLRLET